MKMMIIKLSNKIALCTGVLCLTLFLQLGSTHANTCGNRILEEAEQCDWGTSGYEGALITEGLIEIEPVGGMTAGPDQTLYIVDKTNEQILRYDIQTGKLIGSFSIADQTEKPTDITFGPDGNLYLSDYNLGKVLKFNGTTGGYLGVFVDTGEGDSMLIAPTNIVFDDKGYFYVTSSLDNHMFRYHADTGSFDKVFIPNDDDREIGASNILFGPDEKLYLSDLNKQKVYQYNANDGTFIKEFIAPGIQGVSFKDIHFGPDNNLYIPNNNYGPIYKFDGVSGQALGTLMNETFHASSALFYQGTYFLLDVWGNKLLLAVIEGNSDTLPNHCRTTCQNPSCGDGVIDSGEECDDGNSTNEDGCNNLCQIDQKPSQPNNPNLPNIPSNSGDDTASSNSSNDTSSSDGCSLNSMLPSSANTLVVSGLLFALICFGIRLRHSKTSN